MTPRPLLLALLLLLPLTSPLPLHAQNQAAADQQNQDGLIRLQLPSGNISSILTLYQELTDREIILDATVDPEIQMRVVTRNPLPRDQAARFIESTLLLNGHALVPTETPNIYKLVVWTGERQVAAEGIQLYTPGDLNLMPQGDEIISYVMPLTHINAEEAAELMAQVVQLHPYGNISPSTASNTLVITENASIVRSLIDLQRYVDVPSAQTDTRWIRLERADAERVAESMSTLLDSRTPSPTTQGQGGGAIQAQSAGNTELSIVPDTRTNRILLHGRPADISYYSAIIEQFDAPDNRSNILRREMRYLAVRDFLPVAAQALTRGNDTEVRTQAGEGDGLDSLNDQNQGTDNAPQSTSDSNLLVSQIQLEDNGEVGIPDAIVIGRTLLVADNQANALIVTGPPEQLQLIDELANQLDQRPRQIMISTIIGQLNLNEGQTLGVDLVRLADQGRAGDTDFTLAGQNVNGNNNNIVNPLDLGDLAAFPAVGGFSLYGRIGDNLNAYINAISTQSDFDIVSRPSVFTRNNERAIISTGQRIAIPSQTISSINNDNGNFSTSIEYIDVNLELEVIPLINSSDEVTLQIRQINNSIAGTQIINGNEVPTVQTQGLVTTVTIPNGSTLVLGGLITERIGTEESGVPLLRKIPLIGSLFGSETDTEERQELMIFIQPQIIESPDDLLRINQEEIIRSEAADAALEFQTMPERDSLDPDQLERVELWRQQQERAINPPAQRPVAPNPVPRYDPNRLQRWQNNR